MKKKIIDAIIISSLTILGGAIAYWQGNQPAVTFYPNGEINTSAQRKFYKKNGEYKIFRDDGTLSQKYNLIDGNKVGKGTLYAGAATVDVNYNQGILSGPLDIDTKGTVSDLENLHINISDVVTIEYENKDNPDLSSVKAEGKLQCSDTEFLDNMQEFLIAQNFDNFKKLSKCISLTNLELDSDALKCKFEGDYQFPRFNNNSQIKCEAKENSEYSYSDSMADFNIPEIKQPNTILSYDIADEMFSFTVTDKDEVIQQVHLFKGIDDALYSTVEFAFSKQETQDMFKMISSSAKSFVISDNWLNIQGKPISVVKGSFNFINGFSNPWIASLFGLEDTMTLQTKITDKGVVFNAAYPISKKPMISIGIQVNEKFKDKYQSFVSMALSEASENPEETAIDNVLSKLPEYNMDFADIISSVNALLMNNKGEKILGAVLNAKQGIDVLTAMENFENAFTIKMIMYKNNKPNKVISGDMENGFIADNTVITSDKIIDYLDRDTIEDVLTQISDEIYQAYEIMQKNPYNEPITFNLYGGYIRAMEQYKSSDIPIQVSLLANNIREAYVDSENFTGINNTMLQNLKIVPEYMINDGKIVNAFDGGVSVNPSPAFENDEENLAFVIQFDGLPLSGCIAAATYEWNDNSGMIGVGINKGISDLYIDKSENIESDKCTEEGILCAAKIKMKNIEAISSCKENNNSVSFKFQ